MTSSKITIRNMKIGIHHAKLLEDIKLNLGLSTCLAASFVVAYEYGITTTTRRKRQMQAKAVIKEKSVAFPMNEEQLKHCKAVCHYYQTTFSALFLISIVKFHDALLREDLDAMKIRKAQNLLFGGEHE